MTLKDLDQVRIVALRRDPVSYSVVPGETRMPRVGEWGTIVDIRRPGDPASPVVVEKVESNGTTAWLCEFTVDEVEFVHRAERISLSQQMQISVPEDAALLDALRFCPGADVPFVRDFVHHRSQLKFSDDEVRLALRNLVQRKLAQEQNGMWFLPPA